MWITLLLFLNLYYLLLFGSHDCEENDEIGEREAPNHQVMGVLRHHQEEFLPHGIEENNVVRNAPSISNLDNQSKNRHDQLKVIVEKNNKYAYRDVPVGHAPSCSGCMIRNFRRMQVPRFTCKTGSDVNMLMLVSTTAVNIRRRQAVRETWGSLALNNTATRVRVVFMLGLDKNTTHQSIVVDESAQYGDILQEDFIDSYDNLTYKSLMGFTWASQECPDANYVIKTDDDVFFNIAGLEKLFSDWEKVNFTLTTQLMGFCKVPAHVVRDPKIKWHVPYHVYPYDFPGYCSGTGYVVTMSTAIEILRVSPNIPFIYLEDVYIGFCIDKLGYDFRSVQGFNPFRVEVPQGACINSHEVMTSHGYFPQDLLAAWKKCHNVTTGA